MIVDGFEISADQNFELIRSVYGTSEFFCSEFSEAYQDIEALQEFLMGLKQRPGALFLVEKNLTGFLFLEPRTQNKLKHTCDLNMGVGSAARGKGIGRELLEHAILKAKQQNILEIIYLMVRSDNVGAVKLYRSVGFEELALLNRDIKSAGRYYDGMLMRKFL